MLQPIAPTPPTATVFPVASATGTTAITVFLLDDNDPVRGALVSLVDSKPDLRLVGEAATAQRALELIPLLHPDVAVLDIQLPDGNGIDVCRHLHDEYPEIRCLMLTSAVVDDEVRKSLDAGARGFVVKNLRGLELGGAIREVAAGRVVVDPAALPPATPGWVATA